jgi:hypothetical protein
VSGAEIGTPAGQAPGPAATRGASPAALAAWLGIPVPAPGTLAVAALAGPAEAPRA